MLKCGLLGLGCVNLLSMRRGGSPYISEMKAALSVAVALICTGPLPLFVLGCGMAASPQPPSLQLPRTVHDLTAARAGNRVSLHWTTPKETTDRLKIKAPVLARICRQAFATSCETVATVAATPGKPADYAEVLPETLTSGPLQAMTYTVFLLNRGGRSAGPSNAAHTLAGEAPPAVQGLSANMVERGVLLHWEGIAQFQPHTSIRLQRTLLHPRNSSRKASGGLPLISEPIEQTLQVSLLPFKDTDKALDSGVLFNREYRYVAQRVVTIQVGTEQLQMASSPSVPVSVLTRDTFPPAAPTGLAAVPISPTINGGKPEVDLSWSANAEPDLARYLVYRRTADSNTSTGQPASNAPASQQIALEDDGPIVAPAFRDVHVQAGHTYAYVVVAVDNAGNRSPKSAEVLVTVPGS